MRAVCFIERFRDNIYTITYLSFFVSESEGKRREKKKRLGGPSSMRRRGGEFVTVFRITRSY